jgi:hypothetical protein
MFFWFNNFGDEVLAPVIATLAVEAKVVRFPCRWFTKRNFVQFCGVDYFSIIATHGQDHSRTSCHLKSIDVLNYNFKMVCSWFNMTVATHGFVLVYSHMQEYCIFPSHFDILSVALLQDFANKLFIIILGRFLCHPSFTHFGSIIEITSI